MVMEKNTVAIIGSHSKTRGDFDFSRTDCHIWLFNEAISNIRFENEMKAAEAEKDPERKAALISWAHRRADAIFQIHDEVIWRNPANRNDAGHAKWLENQNDVDVYMQEVYPDVPRSIKYPLDEIIDRFKISYFTSSVAYALALACYMNYERIEVYGVEMETNTEYGHQRPGVALWLGVARGLGIEIETHMNMFNAPLYGYEGEVTMPYEMFEKRIAELQPSLDDLSAQYRAAFLDLQKSFEIFENDAGVNAEKALFANAERQRDLSKALGEISGRMQENQRYQGKADEMKKTSGKFIFSRQEFESAASDHKRNADQLNAQFIAYGSKLDILHNNVKAAAKGSPKRKQLMDDYRKAIVNYLKLANQSNLFIGASKENYDFLTWLDVHVQAAGGVKSEQAILEMMQNA